MKKSKEKSKQELKEICKLLVHILYNSMKKAC